MKQIPIRPIGRYFKLDDQGFVLNDTHPSDIPHSYTILLKQLITAYQVTYPDKLHSIWLRGSLARGLFIEKISDIDVFALLKTPNIRWENATLKQFHTEQYPFSIETCISSYSNDFLTKNPALAMQIQTQSHCLWGQDIRADLPLYRPSKLMALSYRWLELDIKIFLEKENKATEEYQSILKLLLRTAFELVMERANQYTPDLYYCYLTSARFYPTKELVLREILWHYLNPLDFERIVYLVRTLSPWIIEQLEDF